MSALEPFLTLEVSVPVDPQIAGILSLLAQFGGDSLSGSTPEEARRQFRTAAVDLRDPSTLVPVRSTADIEIPGPVGSIKARVYRPDVDGRTPTIVFFHGGGWVIGDVDTHDDQTRLICRDVAAVVVSVEYRLAPEHKFPAGFEDCLAATRWVADNIEEFGGDAGKLVVAGDSAGGNLSAGVALAARESGPALAAQFLIYPGLDFALDADYASRVENAEGYFLTSADMIWFREQYLNSDSDALDVRASVIAEKDLHGLPPAVIVTAEYDPLRDEGEAYGKALSDAGVEVRLHRVPGMIHGFFGLGVHSAAAARAVSEVDADLKALLAG